MCFRPTSSFWFHLNSKSYTPPPFVYSLSSFQ